MVMSYLFENGIKSYLNGGQAPGFLVSVILAVRYVVSSFKFICSRLVFAVAASRMVRQYEPELFSYLKQI
ncbi:hypothetical protein VNO78_07898 [Psophocarpus tetragonolobus]|uniref:Uncharacterized protein n=1 Tax=Psophocarpus tetragonolobus TaxID=3891 RepID=A0AAN9SV09_PSOTE